MSAIAQRRRGGTDEARPYRVIVIGVGGGGGNAVSRMYAQWPDGPDVTAVNTDAKALAACSAPTRVQIGRNLTNGLGAGGDPNVGKLAAEDDVDMLRELVSQADLVFLVTALGGGTGTGAAPLVARVAREEGALVLCFATLPFEFEGERRRRQAEDGLRALRMHADVVISMPNQRLLDSADGRASLADAFEKADAALGVGIRALWKLLAQTGIINLDFADLRHLIEHSGGTCAFGYGEATGAGKAAEAVNQILRSPLLDRGERLGKAGALLISIVGGPDLTLVEVKNVMSKLGAAAKPDARRVMGAAVDETWQNRLAVTVLAAENFEEEEAAAAAPEAEPGLFSKQALGAGKPVQEDLKFDPVDKGRFKGVDPTVYQGEDLDIPTYIRRRIPLSSER